MPSITRKANDVNRTCEICHHAVYHSTQPGSFEAGPAQPAYHTCRAGVPTDDTYHPAEHPALFECDQWTPAIEQEDAQLFKDLVNQGLSDSCAASIVDAGILPFNEWRALYGTA